MRRWGWIGALTCVLLSVASRNAQAQYRHRVVLLEHEGDDDAGREITTRVRAELGAAGFDVWVLPVANADPQRAVESAGHELHPASVLLIERLLSSGGGQRAQAGAELWLADRLLRKTVVLRLPSEDAQGQAAARIAVQAVELVKARLAELALTREREREKPATPLHSPSAPLAAPAPRGAHPSLTLGFGALEGFQAGQRAFAPVLRLGVVLPERWTAEVLAVELRGEFVGLGTTARVEHAPGAATLRHTLTGLDVVARFLPRLRVQPLLSLGAGLLALDVAGDAPDPYRNDSSRTLSGLVAASGGLWLQPLPGFGVVLEAQLMNAWSKTVVRIAGEEAAEVAAPLLLVSGGLMWEFR